MQQNLSSYYTFYMAAKAGNISAASKQLFISQPAVSKAVSRLEKSLNTTLLLRSSKGVSLTNEGRLLYERLAEAFHSIELGEEQLKFQSEKEQQHLTIGVSTTLCKYILLPHLKEFIKNYPHIRITINSQSSYETINALSEGKIDLGLIGETTLPKDFIFEKTHEITDTFVATRDYLEHLRIRTDIDCSDPEMLPSILSNSTLMLMHKQNLSRIFIDGYINAWHLHPENIIEVSTMELLIEFAAIGLGTACVIRDFIREELKSGTLLELPSKYPISSRNIGFIYKRDPSPALEQFLDSCSKD